MVDFYEMNFMKGIVILIKEDKMQYLYNILKGQEIKLKLNNPSCCWSLPLSVHIFTVSLFIKGQASSPTRYSCRERVWYYNIDDTGAR